MNPTPLDEIVASVRNYAGLTRKLPIKGVVQELSATHEYGNALPNYGDDAAVIPFKDEFLLFATDGMMTGLILNEPYAAGKASVMVTVNDIFSMGGRPLGLVNVLASGDEEERARIVSGIKKGCQKLQVPMLGGHLHPDPGLKVPSLSVAILGHAKKTLRSHLAKAGDDLILAIDLSGKRGCSSVTSWDANSGKTPEELHHRLEALPLIAEKEWSCAAKDISNAGILGTISIFMENSGKGAWIDVEKLPRPKDIDLLDWLHCFQSYGFILSVHPDNSPKVLDLFSQRKVDAAVVGQVTATDQVIIENSRGSKVLFDFQTDEITGIRYQPGEGP
ncbi:AIR synthase related protein [Desulfospira joergensenii]|uniref:AIR synthase related protein n=1 Tax=Desulfospira joergensenii TaxID=53329 RepID=UPI000429311A|nr:AIR synthase related protein [Desulfospira joergensenii]